ncbi:MAG: hypothetical protein K8F92_08520 [Hyphomicrobium sp.]|uniref:TlpA family protein disulfide reductase n=1 Tax=Hyphomicrobium sp. TaxID=82 RepID=UPI00132BCBC3|nr:hypothetical protein [Hyphomicrobium sp.]KAB2943586.1 MAG: hypothetical protein F9K20_02660 [Hyphomicrobium sp.]MBZ0209685.1 hypothetical protein [Hyphomicrobium sp.]
MNGRWVGLASVLLAAVGVVTYKQVASGTGPLEAATSTPSVLLVADLNEAGDAGDGCAQIISAVRSAGKRGIEVAELMPNNSSKLLARYRVVAAPTVIIIDKDGRETARYEGEDTETVQAIEAKLATLGSD